MDPLSHSFFGGFLALPHTATDAYYFTILYAATQPARVLPTSYLLSLWGMRTFDHVFPAYVPPPPLYPHFSPTPRMRSFFHSTPINFFVAQDPLPKIFPLFQGTEMPLFPLPLFSCIDLHRSAPWSFSFLGVSQLVPLRALQKALFFFSPP